MHALIPDPAANTLVLADRPEPEAGADQVLVRTRAVSLNNADGTIGDGDAIAGFEFAGVVEAVGPGSDDALVGRRVFGLAPGAFAERVVAHRRHVLEIPEPLDFDEASPLITAVTTEYGALRRAGVRHGSTVLLTAATSGIALVGAQVARVLGAGTVIGTTRSRERAEVLDAVGVDHVVVTGEEDLQERVLALTAGAGADVVLDHVGGPMLRAAVEAARVGGAVVSVGRLAGPTAELDLFRLAARQVVLQSVSYGLNPPEVLGALADGVRTDVLPAVADGRVRAVVDSSFAFADAASALDRLRGGTAGKIVLTLD